VTVRLPAGVRGPVRVTRDGGKRVKRVRVHGRTITVKGTARTVTLRAVLGRRPHGRATVSLVRTNGKRYTLRPKAARLR
jgi:hypothetical protein